MENRIIIGVLLVIFATVVFGFIFGIAGFAAVIIIIIVVLWYSNRNKKKILKSQE